MPEQRHETLLGFDYGAKRIGVAVGQTASSTSEALQTIQVRREKPDWDAIAKLVEDWEPSAFIVGMPSSKIHGKPAELAEVITRFMRQLGGRFSLPVYSIDERLSSAAAEQRGDVGQRGLDAIAAQIILESWLTENANGIRGDA
jgi:putative Holliday junction resolvase